MSGYRTLLCIDGIRLNNPITRASSNNWVGTIDPFIIDKIEIVRGPMSVLYGSDALGGIVNYITQSPKITNTDHSIGATIKGLYYSPSRSYSGHADLLAEIGNISFIGGGTYGYTSDLRTSDNKAQKPSSYHWRAGNGNLLYYLSQNSTLNFVIQAHLNYDVQEYNKSGPSEENFTSYQNYRPILDRELTYVRYNLLNQGIFEEIMLTLSFQRVHEQKKDYKWKVLPPPNHGNKSN